MSDGLTISEMSMLNDLSRLQTISHNLTNVNTTGYKQQVIKTESFNNVINIVQSERNNAGVNHQVTAQMPVIETTVDGSAGAMKYTGDPLNVALGKNLYMVVETPHGHAFTRQGDLHIDGRGRLVTSSNMPVMGVSGEIRLTSDKPIIDEQGKIFIEDKNVGEIKFVRFSDNAEIVPIGSALYQTTRDVAENVNEQGMIRQGYLEASNVNMTSEMIRMMEVTRHFESTQQMIKGYDDMMDKAINVIGEL